MKTDNQPESRLRREIHSATVLHKGWEMDNRLWVNEWKDGTREVWTTSHGLEYRLSDTSELEEKITETQNSLEQLKEAKRLIDEADSVIWG